MNRVRKINKIRKGHGKKARAFGANCLTKACVVSEVYACGGNGAALAHLNAGGVQTATGPNATPTLMWRKPRKAPVAKVCGLPYVLNVM